MVQGVWPRVRRTMSAEPPHLNDPARPEPAHFPCSQCEVSFNAERNLVLHRAWAHPMRSPAETAESVFQCPICPRTFLRPASFKGHLSLHSESENVVCPQCDDEFQSRTELARHQSTQHGQVEEPEMVSLQRMFKTCTQCQQIFASAQQLRIHREKHVKIREMTKSKFKRPTPGRKSKEDKPHLCSYCPSSFSKQSYRIRHERTHTGEKPFQCQFCDKRFNQNETRKIHELKHSGKRPHACQLCPMSFTQRGNLKTHVYRVHSITLKSNDYLQCQQCSCAFKKLSSLNTHITRRHPKCLLSETPDQTESREEGAENVKQGQESSMKVALPLKGKSEGHFIMQFPAPNEKDLVDPVPSVGSMDQNVGTPFSKSVASPCAFNESIGSPGTPGLTSQYSQPSTPAIPVPLEMPVNESKVNNNNEVPMDIPKNAILEAEAQAGTIILDPNVLGMDIDSFMIEDRGKQSPTLQLKTSPRPTFNETSSNVFKELDLCHQNNRPKEGWDDGSTLELVKPGSLTTSTSQRLDTKELDEWKPIGEDRTLNGAKTAKSKHKCQYCDKQFIKNSDLLRHIRVHTGERPFACDQCHKKFSLKSTLISHKRLHSDQRTKLTCDQCGDKFLSKTSLRSHIRLHSSEAPYQCRSCPQRFQTPVQRRAHAISVHEKPRKDVPKSKDKPNGDDPSLKISVPASSLIEALNSVTNVGVPLLGSVVRLQLDGVHMESAIAQLEVDEALLSQLKFGGNVDIVINGDQVISTPIEPPLEEMIAPDVIGTNAPPPEPNQREEQGPQTHSDFAREPEFSSERKRLPNAPSDASGLSCQFCSKTFKKPSQTKRHERIHTGERPYECQECSKRFNQSNALKIHMKKHSGERPFICPFCSFAFTQKCNLKTHICRAHSVQAQQLIEYANWDV